MIKGLTASPHLLGGYEHFFFFERKSAKEIFDELALEYTLTKTHDIIIFLGRQFFFEKKARTYKKRTQKIKPRTKKNADTKQ